MRLQENEKIRLKNKTAHLLRRHAEHTRWMHLLLGVVFSVAISIPMLRGWKSDPVASLAMLLVMILSDLFLYVHCRGSYLLYRGQAICTEAAILAIREKSEAERRDAQLRREGAQKMQMLLKTMEEQAGMAEGQDAALQRRRRRAAAQAADLR